MIYKFPSLMVVLYFFPETSPSSCSSFCTASSRSRTSCHCCISSSRKASTFEASEPLSDTCMNALSRHSSRSRSIARSRDCISFHFCINSACRVARSPASLSPGAAHSCSSCSTARCLDCMTSHFCNRSARRSVRSEVSVFGADHSWSSFSTALSRACISCHLIINLSRRAVSSEASVAASSAGPSTVPKVNRYSFVETAAIIH
mmetsp:Transcript_63620/g.106104  ORF Transcript_63620/g.106104 Transcript_63620/m.106104 type:complete len:204 (+) Transcript_63620:1006-1617(+)